MQRKSPGLCLSVWLQLAGLWPCHNLGETPADYKSCFISNGLMFWVWCVMCVICFVKWCDVMCDNICRVVYSSVLILRFRSGHLQPPAASLSGGAAWPDLNTWHSTIQSPTLLGLLSGCQEGIVSAKVILHWLSLQCNHHSFLVIVVFYCRKWSSFKVHFSRWFFFVVFRVLPPWGSQSQSRVRSTSLPRDRRSWRSASLSTILRLGKYWAVLLWAGVRQLPSQCLLYTLFVKYH